MPQVTCFPEDFNLGEKMQTSYCFCVSERIKKTPNTTPPRKWQNGWSIRKIKKKKGKKRKNLTQNLGFPGKN